MSGGHDGGPTDAPVRDVPSAQLDEGPGLDRPQDITGDTAIDVGADVGNEGSPDVGGDVPDLAELPDVPDVGPDIDAGPRSCTSTFGCPLGQACDPTSHTCTTSCSSTVPCNGGCCSATTNGTCQPGDADDACGGTAYSNDGGGVCQSCATTGEGPRCLVLHDGTEIRYCGCTSADQCPALWACGTGSNDTGPAALYRCQPSNCHNGVCNGGCCLAGTGGGSFTCVAQCPGGVRCGAVNPNYCN
jgi:hypothetical protein